MRISDETQRDPKESDHMGASKHERLFFSMSPTGTGTADSVPYTVERLVERLMSRGKGSYISSMLRDCTVQVEVLNLGVLWKWEVKKGREVVDYGIAKVTDQGVALEKGEVCPNCVGTGFYDDQTCTFCDGECRIVLPTEEKS